MPERRRVRGTIALAAAACVTLWARSSTFAAPNSRRDAVAGGVLASLFGSSAATAYDLPTLPYDYDALEPSIDKETMMFHHDKHHATYIGGINKALEGSEQPPLLDLIKGAIKSGKKPYRNAGGGVWNHDFFWLEMGPASSNGKPSAKLEAAIKDAFGSMDGLKETFDTGAAPAALFGSGWAWVVVKKDGKLAFTTTANQDNPLMEGVDATEGIPVLGLDIWEHAYYLKYQNRRPDYVKAWWDVVNWNQVNTWYEGALDGKAPDVDSPAAAAALASRKKAAVVAKKPASFNFKANLETSINFGT